MSSLILLGDHRSYHLYRKETDMRKGFNLLCGIITNELGRHVTKGDAFIFINKPRTHLKRSYGVQRNSMLYITYIATLKWLLGSLESGSSKIGYKHYEKSLRKRSTLNAHAAFDEPGGGNMDYNLMRHCSNLPVGSGEATIRSPEPVYK